MHRSEIFKDTVEILIQSHHELESSDENRHALEELLGDLEFDADTLDHYHQLYADMQRRGDPMLYEHGVDEDAPALTQVDTQMDLEKIINGSRCFLAGDRSDECTWAAEVLVAYKYREWSEIRDEQTTLLEHIHQDTQQDEEEVAEEAREVLTLQGEADRMVENAKRAQAYIFAERLKGREN